MNDIDFDELDEAVNSLVNKNHASASEPREELKSKAEAVPVANPEPPENSESTVTPEPAININQMPALDIPKRSARLGAKPPVVPAVARGASRGFMDILPSSKQLTKAPSRTAGAIKPISDVSTIKAEPVPEPTTPPPISQLKPEAGQPESRTAARDEAQQKANEQTPEWPDPINLDTQKETPAEEPVAENPPNSTPFIPTKVEKRPLGAYSAYTPPEPEPEPEKPEEPAVSSREATPAAPELQPDILAVESGEPQKTEVKPVDQPQVMAIPKQYKTTEKAVDETPRPIYDAKEYHPPLLEPTTHHPKKRTGLVVGIIFLVILLAIIGYVVYLVMTGGLDLTKFGLGS